MIKNWGQWQAQARYCLDPVAFAKDCLGVEPDRFQRIALNPTIQRGILNCGRQTGKSTVMAIKALHLAVTQSRTTVVVLSPTERQAGEFFHKIREFAAVLGVHAPGDGFNRISAKFANGSRILGVSGRTKARGISRVSLLLVDEAAEVPEIAFKTMKPMMATSPHAALWLMSTPEGRQGLFWQIWSEGGDRWHRLSVPSTECPRIAASFLEEERATMGDTLFRQEYLCEFLDTPEVMFPESLVRCAVRKDVPPLWK